jgi:hypothetical protein
MSTTSIFDDEIISFPVPKRFLPLVIQALAKAMEPEVTVPAETAGTQAGTEHETQSIDWTQISNMKILRKGLKLPIGLKLLDMTAARPGEWISFKEIYTAAGFTETRRAGSSLGSLTKVIKRDFGVPYEEAIWPVEHQWAVNNDAQVSYRMSEEVKQAWLQSAT